MLSAITNSWALLFGMFLLQIGNGLQGTVLGVRGASEGFSSATMGYVMAAYFVGFMGGSQITPWLLRRVGHVRVFAALASLISAALILYAAVVHPVAWLLMRLIIGFCFSGVYVVAESWLNDSATNETRGKTIGAYVTVQMLGIVLAQAVLNVADPGGYDLFVIMSVLVSISFAPILLSSSPTPVFETTRGMTLARLFHTSPLGCVSMFALGATFACMFGMSAVYAGAIGLGTLEVSVFVGALYLGGMILQLPIAWVSDQIDRRILIICVTATCALAAGLAVVVSGNFPALVFAAFVIGGMANPLYSLIIAYVNDYLEHEDMAAASGGLILINGIGAMGAPVVVGYAMDIAGPSGFFVFIAICMVLIVFYALFRMVRRERGEMETTPVVALTPATSRVAVDVAWDAAMEQAMADTEAEQEPPVAKVSHPSEAEIMHRTGD